MLLHLRGSDLDEGVDFEAVQIFQIRYDCEIDPGVYLYEIPEYHQQFFESTN